MAYLIHHRNFVCVEFIDPHGAKAVEDFIADIIKNFSEKDLQRILVDARKAEVNDKVYNITEVMSRFESLGVPKSVRIAVVRRASADSGKYHEIMKSVVTNIGYNFQLFTDLDSAVSWLHQE